MKRAANQGVGDFRFINILQLFSIYSFFQLLYFIIVFYTFFYPGHLPTPAIHDLLTTHDPRQLATLKGLLFMTFNLNAFIFLLAFSANYYLENYFVYRNWIDEFLHCQRKTLNFF